MRTPETYLGFGRGEHFASPNGPRSTNAAPTGCRGASASTSGPWRGVDDRVGERGAGPGRRWRRLPVPRTRRASRAGPGAGRAVPFHVLLDGAAPGPSHGVDVDEDGNGVLQDARLHQLVRQDGAVRERTLEITFDEPGVEAYAFTFG
ncbi:hypothetical protein NKG94_46535 [Micromonospora sp. M12]